MVMHELANFKFTTPPSPRPYPGHYTN